MKQRLQTLCACIDRQYTSLLDIGYDHGQVMHWALAHGFEKVIGVETAAHFAQRYRAVYADDQVDVRTGDGLQEVAAGEAEVLIFSGLGEQHIRKMLAAGSAHLESAQQIIFSPSSIDLKLRVFLNQHNWRIESEHLVQENGRVYVIASAVRGSEHIADTTLAALAPRLCESARFAVCTSRQDLDIYLRFIAQRFHYNVDEYMQMIYKKIASLTE